MAKVFVRPRPLAAQEQGDACAAYEFDASSSSVRVADRRFRPLAGLLSAANAEAHAAAVRPLVRPVLAGRTACCFAYGHTNSGKTHTIFGYGEELGVCQRAVRNLFAAAAAARNGPPLLLQLRFLELYNGKVFDLLNERQPGFVRVGADGAVHVRSETAVGPGGEGTSELHAQSSRSHGVLELEVVTPALARARIELVDARARVVPLGKARDDLFIAIQSKLFVVGPDGKYAASGAQPAADEAARLQALQERVEAAEAAAQAAVQRVADARSACVGGALVFVDLAGAENTGKGLQRSPAELREAKEINASLLALKECIRAQASARAHVPYRNSKLTMLLKAHLRPANASTTVMIANVSSSASHAAQAVDTLKYAALLADAFEPAA